jgi:integrase
VSLNKKIADAARYEGDGKSRDIRWDDRLTGLGLRVYPSGKKSFVLQYRAADRRVRLLTLGPYGVLTVDQARDHARRHLVGVRDGEDPVEERRTPKGITVADFAEVYLERHSRPRKRTWKEDERRLLTRIVPALGTRRMEDLRRSDIASLHGELGKDAPIEANRVLTLLGGLFTKAEEWGHVPEGHPNPARRVSRFPERSRERWLKPAEMEALVKAVQEEVDPFIQAAVMLYLLTGLRKRELLRARWEHVDIEAAALRIPETKSGRPHTVPLSSPALEILSRLPRDGSNPWVFPGTDGTHRKDFKRAWERVRAKAGLEDLRLHDLRRTVGSWMAQAGVPLQVIGEILNHSHPAVTRVYARLAGTQSRDALQVFGEEFEKVVSGLGGGR